MIWISFSLLKWGVQRHTSFFKKTVDDLRKMCYHKCTAKAVCGYGGIGRRAWFRSMWGQLHAGSTPVIRMRLFFLVASIQVDAFFFVFFMESSWRKTLSQDLPSLGFCPFAAVHTRTAMFPYPSIPQVS